MFVVVVVAVAVVVVVDVVVIVVVVVVVAAAAAAGICLVADSPKRYCCYYASSFLPLSSSLSLLSLFPVLFPIFSRSCGRFSLRFHRSFLPLPRRRCSGISTSFRPIRVLFPISPRLLSKLFLGRGSKYILD